MGNIFDREYRTTALDVIHRYQTDLTGKTVMVTGCTTGLGPEIVRALALANASVFMTGRNQAALDRKRDEINAELKAKGCKTGTVQSLVFDLASLSSVRQGAADFLSRSSQLHLLVLNAGIMVAPYGVTNEGIDLQFGVNHVGHFLLFQLLLPTLLASAPARVVSVSSNGWHLLGPPRIDYSRLPSVPPSQYKPWPAYQQSKLANLLFARELNVRYAERGLTAYSLNPGAVHTGLQESAGALRGVIWLIAPLLKTVQQGASTAVYCAVAPGLEKEGGRYFNECRPNDKMERTKFDPNDGGKLWDWTEKIIAEKTTT